MFKSDFAFRRIYEITPQFLANENIKGLFLDIDNTLTTHDNPVPADGVMKWIELMKKNGIKMFLVSNNHPPRVKPFADLIGLPFVSEGKKPLSKGFREAKTAINLPKKEIAAIGDQIFTDVMAANLFGIRMIYVSPIEYETTKFFKFKRFMEKPFIPKYYSDGRKNDGKNTRYSRT